MGCSLTPLNITANPYATFSCSNKAVGEILVDGTYDFIQLGYTP